MPWPRDRKRPPPWQLCAACRTRRWVLPGMDGRGYCQQCASGEEP